MRLLTYVRTFMLVLVLTGCMSAGAVPRTFEGQAVEAPLSESIPLLVENNSWEDFRIVVLDENGGVHRLGEVGALHAKTFKIPRRYFKGTGRVVILGQATTSGVVARAEAQIDDGIHALRLRIGQSDASSWLMVA